MDASVAKKLERCRSLPTLPAVAVKIVQLCQQEVLGVDDLVLVVSADPALSAKVLKLVNSAAFGQRQEVRTLSHAVMLMGTNALRALALSFSLVPDLTSRKKLALEAFWKRAVVSAIAARELAAQVGFRQFEEAFLCALLQDLGVLALTQAMGVEYQDLLERAGDDNEALAALERATLGVDHAEIGEWLLDRWRLPEVMRATVRLSHCPERVEAETDEETATLVKITAAAGLLADIWRHPDVAAAANRARGRLMDLFQLSEATVQTLLSRIADAMPEIGPLFDLDLGQPDDIASVLEAAKDALVALNLRSVERVEAAERTIRTLEDRTETLTQEAQRDALTGLGNRRYLERYLEDEFTIASHTGTPLTVMLGDVDRFKAINDLHGHPVGDRVLQAVAGILGARTRPRDVAGRYGGEEFLLVLPNTPADGAAVAGERLREQIEALRIPVGAGQVVQVTMSFGHATASPGAFPSCADLLRAADDALYAAKRAGRNRVVVYDRHLPVRPGGGTPDPGDP